MSGTGLGELAERYLNEYRSGGIEPEVLAPPPAGSSDAEFEEWYARSALEYPDALSAALTDEVYGKLSAEVADVAPFLEVVLAECRDEAEFAYVSAGPVEHYVGQCSAADLRTLMTRPVIRKAMELVWVSPETFDSEKRAIWERVFGIAS